MKKIVLPLVVLSAVLLLSACGEKKPDTTTTPPVATEQEVAAGTQSDETTAKTTACASDDATCTANEATETAAKETDLSLSKTMSFDQTAPAQSGEQIATLTTNHGVIKIRLFNSKTPKSVENFVTHAKAGYYNGLTFHRVIDGFMIQGGDPKGDGTGGESIWEKPFSDEFDPDLSNITGSLAMANAGPNTNGSQFFINQVDNKFLDNRHSVFGQVVEGLDVINEIAKVEVGSFDRPKKDIIIEKIEIEDVN